MLTINDAVLIEDEFLRDGLQNEGRILTLAEKLQFLKAIEAAGVRRIQIGSFVHPKRVPQMANTDELFDHLQPLDGVVYSALVLNSVGLERALNIGAKHLSISMSASATHSMRNVGIGVEEALSAITPVISRALAEGIAVRAGIQSALGCGFEGAISEDTVIRLAKHFDDMGVPEINIADTAGLGNPLQVYNLCSRVSDVAPDAALSLHLHDTRGQGLANVAAGLEAGVRTFDAALGGMGGCPFIPNATGNIATEDTVHMLTSMGIETGIDWEAFAAPVSWAEDLLGRSLPGKMSHLSAAKNTATP